MVLVGQDSDTVGRRCGRIAQDADEDVSYDSAGADIVVFRNGRGTGRFTCPTRRVYNFARRVAGSHAAAAPPLSVFRPSGGRRDPLPRPASQQFNWLLGQSLRGRAPQTVLLPSLNPASSSQLLYIEQHFRRVLFSAGYCSRSFSLQQHRPNRCALIAPSLFFLRCSPSRQSCLLRSLPRLLSRCQRAPWPANLLSIGSTTQNTAQSRRRTFSGLTPRSHTAPVGRPLLRPTQR